MAFHRLCQCEILRQLFNAEIGRGEKLLDQNHLRTFACRRTDQRLSPIHIGGQIP